MLAEGEDGAAIHALHHLRRLSGFYPGVAGAGARTLALPNLSLSPQPPGRTGDCPFS